MPGQVKEFGKGVKDKFTGDYIDGPKELAKGLVNDPKGTAQAALSGTWEEVSRPFQDAKQACDAAGGGLLGNATCGLGWANAAVNYPNMLIASQVADDDVKESIQNGELSRAGGQFLYNGTTVAVPFLKGGKLLKTIGKTEKPTKPNANGKNDQADGSRKACRTHSFLPGTPVLLADGSRKPIEQIRTGETVLATDPISGLTAPRTVTDTITTEDDKHFTRLTARVSGQRQTITATDTHPFWLSDRHRWADASDIRPGNRLRTPSGGTLQVTNVFHYAKQQRTHDLTIKGIHTYYVGISVADVLVHNNNGCKEVEFGPYNHYEQARKDALDKLGEVDPHTRKSLYGRLETAKSTYGKKIGFTTRVNGVYKEFRMDYDPKKGPHINVTVGKGKSAKKYAVKWEGTEKEFERLLKGNS